ncbi:polysaccharide deacetylase family protein [Chitinophaga alhagiae]|uniref:polysaccharide deacetylase family protein n=1 Tax=Chitinophaga alhagiae TaxID=2203219 RepID=UPI000E5A8245|nr:polysaccharide deacetylase family protein [Chitinophaga alhagiae]
MSIAKRMYYQAARLVNLSLLKGAAPTGILLPYHHLVSDEQVPYVKHLYPYKGVKAFQRDLDYLLKHFKPVSLQEVIAAIRRQAPLPAHTFLLTFDDGLKEVAEVIAPLLRQKGIPAAFFLNSAFIDNRSLFYRFKISLLVEALLQPQSRATLDALAEVLAQHKNGPLPGVASPESSRPETLIQAVKRIRYHNRALTDAAGAVLGIDFNAWLAEHQPFMSSDQVRKLVEEGFAIGGHSIDHPYYQDLTLEEMLRQTTASVDMLAERFGLHYKAFAFPHSDAGIPKAFFDRLLQGPEPAVDVIFGTNNQRRDIYPGILHRFNCERPELDIAAAVKGILIYNRLQKVRGQSVIRRD